MPSLLDRAGWHTTPELKMPENITLLFLPAQAPEPNPRENIWQHPRQTYLSNRGFASYDAILDAACEAWNRLLNSPGKITSIGLRDWAQTGQSQ